MSYDYKIFRTSGMAVESLEELMETPQPFESYESVKATLSRHCPGIVWNDSDQRGTMENDVGRFEFDCDDASLALGMLSLSTSFRQDVAASHRFLQELCQAAGLAVVDEQTMEIISAT